MAKMKQSLQDAMMEAEVVSRVNPDRIVYVIDKPRHKAKCFTIGWLAIHEINCNGYHPVATFKNGKQVFK